MSTKDTLENMARNTWLAGLGSIDSSKDALGKSIDAAQAKSNSLYNEFLTRGEEIQSKLNHKKDEIQAKGKKLFGIGSQESQEEKLAQLNIAVDQLTSVVVNLIEKRNTAAIASAKVTKAAPKATVKVTPKTVVAPKTAETIKNAEKPIVEATAEKA